MFHVVTKQVDHNNSVISYKRYSTTQTLVEAEEEVRKAILINPINVISVLEEKQLTIESIVKLKN